MKTRRFIRKVIRLVILIKRSIDVQFISRSKHLLNNFLKYTYQVTDVMMAVVSLGALSIIVYDIGINPIFGHHPLTHHALSLAFDLLEIIMIARFVSEWREKKKMSTHIFSFFLVILTFYLNHLLHDLAQMEALRPNHFLVKKITLYGGIVFLFLTEVSKVLRFVYQKSVNPSFLFITSFALIIFIGSILLLLPNATVNGISTVNAIFTSTSAVCVTGLVVVDTATTFTTLGKVILLGLIQIGGLGIMTFTAVLSYLASGSVSFQSQLALTNMFNSKQMSNVIALVSRIILVTFFFEFIGFILIQWSVGETVSDNKSDTIFFALFHSISAFCNAGFSTLSNGLYEKPVRFNYSLHLIVAFLILLGGIGFPIVFNFFTFLREKAINFFKRMLGLPVPEINTRILGINFKLAMTTSGILLGIGFVTYLLFEQENTLAYHPSMWGKIVTSFFGSVTPRTAGFNTVDLTVLNLPTVMVYLLLMYIGASPGSTGGGIKTTTAAVAFLNLGSIIRGKNRTEVFHTQVSEHSINRAFAVVVMSLLILGLGILLIAVNDSDKGLLRIAFEVFSAFATVGLTLGLTSDLSASSKIVLIVIMFVGRVGALTILIAFMNQAKQLYYRYPSEEIIF
ncbi:MAG TPA: potassium transporter TrkG [Cyclobacteriaceae bacterium]|nr:potassium transporter TrkG [Cyclobacteriaceae bacterium]